MSQSNLPLIVEPEVLEKHLSDPGIRIVDLCRYDIYARQHIPGAVHLDYVKLIRNAPPIMGLLPDTKDLSAVLGELGIGPETHVVAYDEEGGGKASRFLWTLDAIGHTHISLLNGGINAWASERHRLDNTVLAVANTTYPVKYASDAIADQAYILTHLKQPSTCLLDCRTPSEFSGALRRAERAGHIPGAINLDWVLAMNQARNLRFKPNNELHTLLQQRGITPDKEVIVYCHTHHRSAHTYMVLKSLGYPKIKGYPGSWSDWGNAMETPVETG